MSRLFEGSIPVPTYSIKIEATTQGRWQDVLWGVQIACKTARQGRSGRLPVLIYLPVPPQAPATAASLPHHTDMHSVQQSSPEVGTQAQEAPQTRGRCAKQALNILTANQALQLLKMSLWRRRSAWDWANCLRRLRAVPRATSRAWLKRV